MVARTLAASLVGRSRRLRFLLASPLLLTVFAPGPREVPAPRPPAMARANDYRQSAGVRRGGQLTVRLVAQRAQWRPAEEDGVALPADAFGEEGKAPSIPGPLLRAKVGTRVQASIRNALPETLVVHGLREHGPDARDVPVRVPPGEARQVAFTIDVPGAHVYYGELRAGGKQIDAGHGTQLSGVIIGDTTDAPPPERVITVSFWNRLIDSSAKTMDERILFLFNGKIWPHTPRFTYTLGDTVHWRVVDLSFQEHPMHLHGFYFRVDSRGAGGHDSIYTADQQRMAVTENLQPFGNFTLTWVPERAGNWVFHCHKAVHTAYWLRYTLDNVDPPAGPEPTRHDTPHAIHGMSGLVIGVTVSPRPGDVARKAEEAAQRVRVVVQERAGFYGTQNGLGYLTTNGENAPPRDSIRIPGAPVVLTRGIPAAVTVVNHTANATAVHWHGIELESIYDGVAGWSGAGARTAPMIAPGDSFVARFTPPRAGTFIYHTHADDARQLSLGLYAPLIVLEPGERWDPDTDHVLMIGGAFEREKYVVALNGSTSPTLLELRAGMRHRFRVINMTIDEDADLSWFASADSSDSTLVRWRAIGKDGAVLPAGMATERAARLHIAPGETYDFEATPRAGEMRIQVRSANASLMRVMARE